MSNLGKKSALAQVYGIFRFKLEGQPDIYLMLMPNAIKNKEKLSSIDFRFDLKGSAVNRQVLPHANQNNRELLKYYRKKLVLKDQDFRFLMKFSKSDLVNIKLEDKHSIISQIKHDILFLESNNLMDYSLLLAIERIDQANKEPKLIQDRYEIWLGAYFGERRIPKLLEIETATVSRSNSIAVTDSKVL